MEYDIDAFWLRALNDELALLQRQQERLHAQWEVYEAVHRHWRWPAPLEWPHIEPGEPHAEG
jgi:hypothetical protein